MLRRINCFLLAAFSLDAAFLSNATTSTKVGLDTSAVSRATENIDTASSAELWMRIQALQKQNEQLFDSDTASRDELKQMARGGSIIQVSSPSLVQISRIAIYQSAQCSLV